MSAVGFIGPSSPASNLVVRYGVVKVQPALWLPTIVDRMAAEVGSVLLVRSELSKPCAFLSGAISDIPAGASVEDLASIPVVRRLLIPASAASSPPWPTMVVTGLGPNLSDSLSSIQNAAGSAGIEIIAVVGEPETAEAKRELQRALPVGVQPKQILWVPMIDGLHQPWEEVELHSELDGLTLTEHIHDAVDGHLPLSVDELLRGDDIAAPAPTQPPAPTQRGPGVRIAAPVGHGIPAKGRDVAEERPASHGSTESVSPAGPAAGDHLHDEALSSNPQIGFEHLQPCSWNVPGGTGQVVRNPQGDEWAVVLENPNVQQLMAEWKALQALCDSGLPPALGLAGAKPTIHVVVPPEGLSKIPSVPGIRRWCCIDGQKHSVAD